MKPHIAFLGLLISASTMHGMKEDKPSGVPLCPSMGNLPCASNSEKELRFHLEELHLNLGTKPPTNTPYASQSPSRTSSRSHSPVFRSPATGRKQPIRPVVDTKYEEMLQKFTEHVTRENFDAAMFYVYEQLVESDNPDLEYLLGQSIQRGSMEDITTLLSIIPNTANLEFQKKIDHVGIDTWKLIHFATEQQRPSLVALLAQTYHHNVNSVTGMGFTPLEIAARAGDVFTAAMLIGFGAELTKETANVATRAQQYEFVSFLETIHRIRPSDELSAPTSPEASSSPAESSDNETSE